MREIKFRAWDQQKKIYGEVSLLERYDEYRAKENYGHHGRVTLWNPANEDDCGSWGRWIELVDLEQFTGLWDKNGREIYEGDSVKLPYGGTAIVRFGAGKFDSGAYNFTGWYLDFGGERQGEDSYQVDEDSCSEYEVVGNIHETLT